MQEKLQCSASPRAVGPAASTISDGRAKDGRGLRGQWESSGDPGDGGCPPVVPRGRARNWPRWCEPASLRLPQLPPTPPKPRVPRRRKGQRRRPSPPPGRCLLGPGLSSSGLSWELRETRGLCPLRWSRAGLEPCTRHPTGPGCCQAGPAGPALGMGDRRSVSWCPHPRHAYGRRGITLWARGWAFPSSRLC